ncbi:MAG TPA: AAA family ATPase [Treponemataceae bacterium]|nr:AAA family ATPase [Treponemataceae bacterium]
MTTKQTADILISGLSSVIRGKKAQLELFTAAFLSGGHVLLNDVPGLGKTTLARTLAALVASPTEDTTVSSVSFKRIQFTPDLLPYDITGVDVFNPQNRTFEFNPGPVFSDILLADEINRTTPKVQSALLEVMGERQVTSGGITRKVSPLFFVVATQNPVESEGTYPLPVAQLDRFMLTLTLGYPDEEAEAAILHQDPSHSILPGLKPIISMDDILSSRMEQAEVYCHPALENAILHIARNTRNNPAFSLGVSPRGVLFLLHAARTLALIRGRKWIEDRDIYDLCIPVFSHRLILTNTKVKADILLQKITTEILQSMDKKTDWGKDIPNNENA